MRRWKNDCGRSDGIISFLILVWLIFYTFRGYFVEPKTALEAIQVQGWSEPKLVDKHRLFVSFYGCDAYDAAGFEIKANNPAGKKVKVVVCCGAFFKSCTLRSGDFAEAETFAEALKPAEASDNTDDSKTSFEDNPLGSKKLRYQTSSSSSW